MRQGAATGPANRGPRGRGEHPQHACGLPGRARERHACRDRVQGPGTDACRGTRAARGDPALLHQRQRFARPGRARRRSGRARVGRSGASARAWARATPRTPAGGRGGEPFLAPGSLGRGNPAGGSSPRDGHERVGADEREGHARDDRDGARRLRSRPRGARRRQLDGLRARRLDVAERGECAAQPAGGP